MNSTTQRDPYTALLLERRFLLTPSLANYPTGLMIVSVDGTMPYSTAGFYLSLCAPGMGMAADVLRGDLARWLDKTLPSLEFEWVAEVQMEHHTQTGEPLIGVFINNPGFLGAESVDRVLDGARLYLAPSARTNWKRLVTLRQNQRLVPLDFETGDSFSGSYPRHLEVMLPSQLDFAKPRGLGRMWPDDPQERGAAFLKEDIEMALDQFELIRDVFIRPTRDGLSVTLAFNDRVIDRPAHLLNRIEETVCNVLARHASLPGSYSDLVIVPARPHVAEVDDGGDYGSRDEEY